MAAFLCCLLRFICHGFKSAHSPPFTWFLYSSVPDTPLSPAYLALPRSLSHMPSSIVLSPHIVLMNHLINQSIIFNVCYPLWGIFILQVTFLLCFIRLQSAELSSKFNMRLHVSGWAHKLSDSALKIIRSIYCYKHGIFVQLILKLLNSTVWPKDTSRTYKIQSNAFQALRFLVIN